LNCASPAGLATTQVQLQPNWSASKLNEIEKDKWIEPNSDAVADLCELYGGLVTSTEWGTSEPAPVNQILGLAGVAVLP
jgi:hypothetical protein